MGVQQSFLDTVDLTQYSRGWYFAFESSSLSVGEVITRQFFGQDIVFYRTQSGKVKAVEAYCKHLGAHLGHGGTVEGDNIRCPFHGWEYNHDGQCVVVPGTKQCPSARLASWETREYEGLCFFYFSNDEQPQLPFPDFSFIDRNGAQRSESVIKEAVGMLCNVCENSIDRLHFAIVHKKFISFVSPITTKIEPDYFEAKCTFESGISQHYNTVDQTFQFFGGHQTLLNNLEHQFFSLKFMVLATPIDAQRLQACFVGIDFKLFGKRPPRLIAKRLNRFFANHARRVFEEDKEIWENQIYRTRPILSKSDGPIISFRRWISQFYV